MCRRGPSSAPRGSWAPGSPLRQRAECPGTCLAGAREPRWAKAQGGASGLRLCSRGARPGRRRQHIRVQVWGFGFQASSSVRGARPRAVPWPSMCTMLLSGSFAHVSRLPVLPYSAALCSPSMEAMTHPCRRRRRSVARAYGGPCPLAQPNPGVCCRTAERRVARRRRVHAPG